MSSRFRLRESATGVAGQISAASGRRKLQPSDVARTESDFQSSCLDGEEKTSHRTPATAERRSHCRERVADCEISASGDSTDDVTSPGEGYGDNADDVTSPGEGYGDNADDVTSPGEGYGGDGDGSTGDGGGDGSTGDGGGDGGGENSGND